MSTIHAMSSSFYCNNCEHCSYEDADGSVRGGHYRVHNRRASRRNALRDGFGLSFEEADFVVLSRPDVAAFYKLLEGYNEQVWPRRCCDVCEVCKEADKRFRVSEGMKLHKKFVDMLYGCGWDVGFLTITMPSVAPRPEHVASFMDASVRSVFRKKWLRERVFERVKRRVKTFGDNAAILSDTEFEGASAAALLKAAAVLHEHGVFETVQDLDAASERLDAGLESAAGASSGLRVLGLRLKSWQILSASVRSQIELELAAEDKVDGLESSVFAWYQVYAWQKGWLQSVCGPGRFHDPDKVPTFYIPRFGSVRFTYRGSEDGRPRCDLGWFRNPKNVSHPFHQGFVPDGVIPFRASSALFNHLFNGFKKRLANRGIEFWYLGTEEHGSVHPDTDRWFNSESHFHLHLLINLPMGSRNVHDRRELFRELWHAQTGNIYWGRKHTRRVKLGNRSDPFCSRLTDKDAVAHYSSKYLSKDGGRIRTSQELGIRRHIFEDTVLSFNSELSASVADKPSFGIVDGRPRCLERLTEEQLFGLDITEWVGLTQEKRRIGLKPIHVASAGSLPSSSIHRAGGIRIEFSREDIREDGIVPFAYWVPKSVWLEAQDNPLSESAVRLHEAVNSWADTVDEILLPP